MRVPILTTALVHRSRRPEAGGPEVLARLRNKGRGEGAEAEGTASTASTVHLICPDLSVASVISGQWVGDKATGRPSAGLGPGFLERSEGGDGALRRARAG